MKRFVFSLERALAWRRMQARMERLRWEQIRAEAASVEAARKELRLEEERSLARLRSASSVSGEEFAALHQFREYTQHAHTRLEAKRVECEKRARDQAKVVMAKERDVKVLEHLRERRLDAWTAELNRELEQQASEGYLARWRRPSL